MQRIDKEFGQALKKHLTRHVGYNVLILLLGIAVIFFFVLGIVSAFGREETVAVPETVTVSASPIDADGGRYELRLQGQLRNNTDGQIRAEELLIVVEKDGRSETVVLTDLSLPSRALYEVLYTWESSVAFDQVTSVSIRYGGETYALSNYTSGITVNADLVFYWAIAAVFTAAGIYFLKQRYYLAEEDRMSESHGE